MDWEKARRISWAGIKLAFALFMSVVRAFLWLFKKMFYLTILMAILMVSSNE